MKPHISQTLEELRAHAAVLGNMIQALEAYGRNVPTEDPPAAPAQSAPSNPTQAAVARVPAALKRRPPSRGKGVRELVKQVAQTLGEFTLGELRAYVAKHHANLAKGIGASSYSSALNAAAKRGLVQKSKDGWVWIDRNVEDSLPPKESAYRQFREQITTPSNGD